MTGESGGRLLRVVSRIVPAERRDAWVREWQAEIAYHVQPGRAGATRPRRWLARRLAAAVQHAVSLRLMGRTSSVTGPQAGIWTGLPEDVRSTLRGWRRAPIFSATVLLTLALGVGLFSAVLSFADGYLFRPLPFPGADRTYYVSDPRAPIASALSAADVVALRESPVAEFGFVEWSNSSLLNQVSIDGRSIDVFAYEVGPGFRKTLALPLAAGRDFTAEDHIQGSAVSAWLSHRSWLRDFGGDWSVVGRIFPGTGPRGAVDLHIVGILGREVSTLDLNNRPPDLVVAAQGPPIVGRNRLAFPLVMLPEGTTVDQATGRIAAALQAASPATDGRSRTVKLSSFAAAQVEGGRPTAKFLFAGAVLVFLLAAMNLVHLLLGRGATRAAEVRTRVALGAGRWRIVRAFVVESVMLGGVGTAGGVFVGQMLSALMAARVPQLPTGARNLAMVPMIFDLRVAGVSAALGLVAAVVGGLWPARRAWRNALLPRMGGGVSRRLAQIILASELTVVTMVAAGVVFASLGVYQYLNQPLGYDYSDRARVTVQALGRRIAGADAVAALDAVRAVAGVRAAGLEAALVRDSGISVPSRTIDTSNMETLDVARGLFEAWGMRIGRGRWFESGEFAGHDVAVVDERFARIAWPERDAVGQAILTGQQLRTVVGVVDSLRWRLDRDPSPTVFLPAPETTGRLPIVLWAPDVDVDDLRGRVTSAVTSVLPGSRVIVTNMTFDALFARGIGEARFQVPVVIAFGVLAGSLALVGVFGIVSFLVQQRTREFGIRIALGARRADIKMAVLQESVRPAIAGLTIGALAAWASASVVESTVFGWHASGLQTIALVAAAILGVAVLAALTPAARAARIDPAVSLRID